MTSTTTRNCPSAITNKAHQRRRSPSSGEADRGNAAVDVHADIESAELELTPSQNSALHLLAAAPGSSSAEPARRAYVTPQVMHRLVGELETRALVTLRPRPGNRRILDAHLTEQSRELITAADARARAVEDRMTTGLDDRQREQLLDLLDHCITALGGPAEGAGNDA